MEDQFSYIGDELDLFKAAVNWKRYFRDTLAAHIKGDVLEVGAGIGGTTSTFAPLTFKRWHCLEPDPQLVGQLNKQLKELPAENNYTVETGTVAGMDGASKFDAVLYIDVLEHIEDHEGEMAEVRKVVKPGGVIIVLSPAHQSLFTPFDERIGHFRRYSKKSLRAVAPEGFKELRMDYIDSIGLMASMANRALLNQSMPTSKQIRTWDSFLVPVSKLMDPLLGGSIGKSVIGVWQAPQ